MSKVTGEKILADLRAGRLPQMVDWFDPALLVRIGIRDLISGTIGQYADQRLMQAASDRVSSEQELALRYDYSDPNTPNPDKRIELDANGAAWVDYISDLGDGFEATYAMASLMAPEALTVRSATVEQPDLLLNAGRVLVMGGDQAYPQATAEEYEARLINPYSWAFTTRDPKRKLFAIPGNHDWYDGLAAFTSLFTAARSRISDGLGRQIGGWRSMQHRSYFAIKLPYDWWIWGPDIQLEGNLDDPQRDYFDIVSDFTKPGDKIILCLAEPSWLHDNYDNLHEINLMARKRGAKVCAVFAGDWHHYSHYSNDELGVPLITCGGGGAFAHATHQLKQTIDLEWAVGSSDEGTAAEPVAHSLSSTAVADQVLVEPRTSDRYQRFRAKFDTRKRSPLRKKSVRRKTFACAAKTIYPSKNKSRVLCLKNLLLPFHNRSFALFVGFVYFLYAWVFQSSAPEIDKKLIEAVPAAAAGGQGAEALKSSLQAFAALFWSAIAPERVVNAATANPAFFFMLLGLWGGLVYYVDLGKGLLNSLGKITLGTLHFLAHLKTLLVVNLLALGPSVLLTVIPTMLAGVSAKEHDLIVGLGFMAMFSIVSVLIGGFIGALIMGLYWTLTSTLFSMHCGDAFGALGIKDYKSFLRLKFEPDMLTIYPIAIDRVPGRKGWRVPAEGEGGSNRAQIVPKKPFDPYLLEDPIIVRSQDVPISLQRVDP